MTHNDDMDDLDRALFALPLDEPPAGLRESILNATVYATDAATAPVSAFGTVETILAGVLLAIGFWLALVLCANPHAAGALESAFLSLARGLAEPTTLAWVVTGALTAIVFSTAGSLRLPFRNGRAS